MSPDFAELSEAPAELAATLMSNLERLRTLDRTLVESADLHLAEFRQQRTRIDRITPTGNGRDRLFDPASVADPELVTNLLREARDRRAVVERLEQRHHE